MHKYVVVTGASKGIGRATALALVSHGFQVIAGVRNEQDGIELVTAGGSAIIPLAIDVTDQPQILAAAAVVAEMVGDLGLAGLVNNAGIAVAAPLEFIPLDELHHQLTVNVVGQIGVTQAFLPLLRQAKGRIINISSMGGRVAGPWTGPYHASKFALEALTDSLRQELAPWGINVVSVQPGAIATPIWENSLIRARSIVARFPGHAHRLYGEQLQKRIARAEQNVNAGLPPEQVAAVILQALTAPCPKTRYQIGTDAKIAVNLIARLPDRWRDWLIAQQR